MNIRAVLLASLFGTGAALPAFACSCPPIADAATQAEGYDFIGVVTVGEVIEIETEEQKADAAAFNEFNADYENALLAYIEGIEAGEEMPSFDDYMDAFYDASTYTPSPMSGQPSTLTQMKVSRVLKGETSKTIFVRSPPANPLTCGVTYRPDGELLLLARGADGMYSTWMCDMAQFPLADFKAALGEEPGAE